MYSTPRLDYAPGHYALEDVRQDLRGNPTGRDIVRLIASLAAPQRFDGNVSYAARLMQRLAPNIDGTVIPSTGFGEWGVEPGVTITTATVHDREFCRAVGDLLAIWGQECAYLERTPYGGPTGYYELRPNGERVALLGYRGNDAE